MTIAYSINFLVLFLLQIKFFVIFAIVRDRDSPIYSQVTVASIVEFKPDR